MKRKLTLRNSQKQKIIFSRKLIIAGSSILGIAAALVVVLNTANTKTSFAKTKDAITNDNSEGVVNATIQPGANDSKSAGSAIPFNSLTNNTKKAAAPFATRSAGASTTVIKSASMNAAFSDAASKTASKEDAAARMRIFTKAYNAKEKDFLAKVKERNLTLANQNDNATADNDVLTNSDPATPADVNRQFVVTYVPDKITAEVLNFDGKRAGKKIILQWSTGLEKNNDYFTIERSSDGSNYEEIAKIDGVGNSLDKSDYKYIDKNPLTGKNYYRLKHTDKTGKADYFPENIVEP